MALFNVNDITQNFSEQDRHRGRTYQHQGRVRELRIENAGSRILAKVQGTAGKPYSVEVLIDKRNGRPVIQTECTCPVTYMCKHGAAAMFETLAQWDRQRERLPASRPYEEERKTALTKSGDLTTWVNTGDKNQTGIQDPLQRQRLIYIISHAANTKKSNVIVTSALQALLKNETWSKPRYASFQQILMQNQYTRFLTEEDHAVFNLVTPGTGYSYETHAIWHTPDEPELIDLFLTRIIETGRAFSSESSIKPLQLGKDIEARLAWSIGADGRQKPILEPLQSGLILLMSNSPWYINPVSQEAGPLRNKLSFYKVQNFLDIPPLTAQAAETMRKERAKVKGDGPLPFRVVKDPKAKPILPVPSLKIEPLPENQGSVACLTFNYGGTEVNPTDTAPHFSLVKKDQISLHKRNKKAETAAIKILGQYNLTERPAVSVGPMGYSDNRGIYFIPKDETTPWFWLDFAHEIVPKLREEGFDIQLDQQSGMDVLATDDEAIEATFTQNGEWWFSLDLGITINGERTPLLPILVSFLRNIHSPADLERLTSGKKCYAPLPDGRFVALPTVRVKTILETLIELFGPKPLDDKGQLRVSFDLATALSKIKDFTQKRWLGEGQLKNLVERLSDFEGISEVELPEGLHAELRPYQKQGYDWLHFLGTYNLGGVLADDMGLGKTVQALAYILALKKKSKTGPCLVVMPTSLITNWQTEAARFTPELSVLTLHGKDRGRRFDEIENADIVLSTYPLVIRDVDVLRIHKWSLIILDEAQAIKNPTSKIMQSVCMLEGKQRLCLTGTPVENHLGEIWSIFAFLMPGLLNDYNSFTKLYRTPIEKHGDAERQNLLSRRLRPFILRRLKSEVTKELPPKTEIIQRITLGDDQRDLYETVRHVMNEKVRAEITDKGFARSQIVLLDALLKLRQVCCDPRLVKLAAASKAQTSAKLSALLDMLPTLIEDGRRILLFSQFTSMLDLIKPELNAANIPFVELRGTTKDRRTPIMQFQNKEVPLFLISLKAGGTGLNLTAADTVIHFDPWWNPSVENQATDRAHRIGQDKPVFVYKLIAEGTIEERILDLQTKKANLASAIFGDTPAAATNLTQDDLKWLMESV